MIRDLFRWEDLSDEEREAVFDSFRLFSDRLSWAAVGGFVVMFIYHLVRWIVS